MIYVIAQFILLAFIAWPIASLKLSMLGLLLILCAMLIALSALITNRPGNFNVRPDPKLSGTLIVHGPYRYIRHPMYTSLFFGGLGILFFQFSEYKLIAWFLLIITLCLKARYEEKALSLHHPEYLCYQQRSKAFIPWIW
jgi:protein-S-isoprenylcysteine O-methyltransferase Ste14